MNRKKKFKLFSRLGKKIKLKQVNENFVNFAIFENDRKKLY